MRSVAFLSPVCLWLVCTASACMSAEMSEASQLSRLERGIDTSTTVIDRSTAYGDVATRAAGPTVVPGPETATSIVTPPPLLDEDDNAPRPTIRVWGAPGGHAPIVSAIVYGDAGAPQATGKSTR
jgi:hypothetical protein